jgi:hypothetical protein
MPSPRLWPLLAASLLLLAACAGGSADPAPQAPDLDRADLAEDAPDDEEVAPPEDLTPDVPDLPEEEPDLAIDPDLTEEEPDLCGVCCPNERRCADDLTAESCDAQGAAWSQTTCSNGATCVGGACIVQCTPGESRCLDGQTLQTCDVSGASFTTRRCLTGVCLNDACQEGALTAQPCEADADCAGGQCLCRGDEACPPELASTLVATGYCTVQDCRLSGCGQDEVCADLPLTGAPICVKRCFDCLQAGFLCRELPTVQGAQTTWAEGCFPADYPLDIGATCDSDADCLGGRCLLGDAAPADGGYCTRACAADADCPSNAACLSFGEELGNLCMRHCGDGTPNSGSCPINRGTFTTCRTREDVAGQITFVCVPR